MELAFCHPRLGGGAQRNWEGANGILSQRLYKQLQPRKYGAAKLSNIHEIMKSHLIFRSCDIFSGFCDTALLIFSVNARFCLGLCHFSLKICHSSQHSGLYGKSEYSLRYVMPDLLHIINYVLDPRSSRG